MKRWAWQVESTPTSTTSFQTSLFMRTWTSSWRTTKPGICEWIVDSPGCSGISLGVKVVILFLQFCQNRLTSSLTYYLEFCPMHISPSSQTKQVGKAIRDKIMDTPFQKDFEEELKDARTWVGSGNDVLTIFSVCSWISVGFWHIYWEDVASRFH